MTARKKFSSPINFIDLAAQRERLRTALENALIDAVRDGKYILGPQVERLEAELRQWTGVRHAITCANGTDAISLLLMAKKIGPGNAVFVPSFTFVATAEVVALRGATPFFVDVCPDTFNLDPASLEKAIAQARKQGLNPCAIIAVDLFGLPADYATLTTLAESHDLWLIADAAQSFGASANGQKVGSMAPATTTSFFPAKPLGCYGDGGAIFTDDDALAEELISLRFHGKGSDKYDNIRIGLNSRLDTIQAAILLEKLKIFGDEIKARQKVADRYTNALSGIVRTPVVPPGSRSVWAQYTITLDDPAHRPIIMEACKAAGVPTMVYYPIPLSAQKAYAHFPCVAGGDAVSRSLSGTVMSLPMHPYLREDMQDYIIDVVAEAIQSLKMSTASRRQATT